MNGHGQGLLSGNDMNDDLATPLLTVDQVSLCFGGVTALDAVSFDVRHGEILGLIGPNGAGKTTCFNVITGVYKPTSGAVMLAGKQVSGQARYAIARLGIARTFQNIRLFPEMTVLDNVLVGADLRHRTSVMGALFRIPRIRGHEDMVPENPATRVFMRVFGTSRHVVEERKARAKALELLAFVGVSAHLDEQARNLSYGEQRRLEIARALATEPKLLCLDEPAAGFNPTEKVRLLELIRNIRDRGVTVVLIEHDMRLVMGATDRIVVLEFGKKIADGSPAEVRADPRVIAAYVGTSDNAA